MISKTKKQILGFNLQVSKAKQAATGCYLYLCLKSLIQRILEAGWLFGTEVEVRARGWLFCFPDFQAEPQYLSLGFYSLCNTFV